MICPICQGNKGFCQCLPEGFRRICIECGKPFTCDKDRTCSSKVDKETCKCGYCWRKINDNKVCDLRFGDHC
jgi:hypothetical protein